jgi:hypothetical protein
MQRVLERVKTRTGVQRIGGHQEMDKQLTPSMRLARTRARQDCTTQIRTRQLASRLPISGHTPANTDRQNRDQSHAVCVAAKAREYAQGSKRRRAPRDSSQGEGPSGPGRDARSVRIRRALNRRGEGRVRCRRIRDGKKHGDRWSRVGKAASTTPAFQNSIVIKKIRFSSNFIKFSKIWYNLVEF